MTMSGGTNLSEQITDQTAGTAVTEREIKGGKTMKTMNRTKKLAALIAIAAVMTVPVLGTPAASAFAAPAPEKKVEQSVEKKVLPELKEAQTVKVILKEKAPVEIKKAGKSVQAAQADMKKDFSKASCKGSAPLKAARKGAPMETSKKGNPMKPVKKADQDTVAKKLLRKESMKKVNVREKSLKKVDIREKNLKKVLEPAKDMKKSGTFGTVEKRVKSGKGKETGLGHIVFEPESKRPMNIVKANTAN